MDNFAIHWHNQALLNRIKSAKPKVDTNIRTAIKRIQDNGRHKHRAQQNTEILQKNQEFMHKLADIYGRKSQY